MRIHAKILLTGKTAAGMVVPSQVVASLGSSKKPPVRVTINGYTYRSTVASMGGKFMLGVSAEVRERAGVSAGDTVDVDIELDTAPREVTVPSDFLKALDRDVKANKLFAGLSYSNKRRFVLQIEGAKTAETRERRLAKAMEMLRMGRV